VFLVCRSLLGALRVNGGGSIVNISSVGGLRGEPEFAAYCSSKFAVMGFTQSLAREVGEFGIRVNAVCPGAVASQMNTETMARDARRLGVSVDDIEAKIIARTSLRRLVDPTDIANAVVFLTSDLASCVTAESVSVTGGVF
jgi:NAD(P)-dependent dehydrogenase (short-subunit alcohol dehydrogenase family)